MKQWICPERVPESQMADWADSYYSVWTFHKAPNHANGTVVAKLNVTPYSGVTKTKWFSMAEYMAFRGHDWRPGYPAKVNGMPREQRAVERAMLEEKE